MEEKIVYFESGGKHNTEATLKLARDRAIRRGIKNVVVASITGYSAEKAVEVFMGSNLRLTIVGTSRRGSPAFSESIKARLEDNGHPICFADETKYELPPV